MSRFDKKIKNLSKEFRVPDSYHQKMDELTETIRKEHALPPKRKPFAKVAIITVLLCLIITGYLSFSNVEVVEAGFLEIFRQTILDFFGVSEDESQQIGIKSEKEDAVSRQDLLIELQEIVMDSQSIYAVVKITAPPVIEFNEDMTFDYFGFCEGTNYNPSTTLAGARSCTLLEVLEHRKNIATFVVSVSTNEQVEEGKEVTVFFKDLIAGPYVDEPEILMEGIWSLSFPASYTSFGDLTITGTDDMKYSFVNRQATVQEIRLLPLGLTVISDVSEVPDEIRNTSDTRLTIRLKMIDGSEKLVCSPDPEAETMISSGSAAESAENGKILQTNVYQFRSAIDTGQVLGIYIEDLYVPVKAYE